MSNPAANVRRGVVDGAVTIVVLAVTDFGRTWTNERVRVAAVAARQDVSAGEPARGTGAGGIAESVAIGVAEEQRRHAIVVDAIAIVVKR